MKKALINATLVIGLLFSTQATVPVSYASVTQSQQVDQVSVDRKDPRTRGKGKKKGLYKRLHKSDGQFATTFGNRLNLDNGNGSSNGKKKGHAKKQPKHKPKALKKRHNSNRPTPRQAPNNQIPQAPRQLPPQCVIIEKPTETRIEYRTRTVTEQVLYGAGILALGGVGAGLLFLFIGYVLGWRRGNTLASRDETEFISSVLNNDKEQ